MLLLYAGINSPEGRLSWFEKEVVICCDGMWDVLIKCTRSWLYIHTVALTPAFQSSYTFAFFLVNAITSHIFSL